MISRQYKFNNSTLTILFGNIIDSKAEVIASSDDTFISMGGGVSGAIRHAGGPEIRSDAQKKCPVCLGDVVVSTAGKLENTKYIFHCLTIDFNSGERNISHKMTSKEELHQYILEHSVNKCFRLLQALDLSSIAFPCLGAGAAHIPLSKVAETMAQVIADNLSHTQKSYQIELYLFDRFGILKETDYIDLFEKFAIKSAFAQYFNQQQLSTLQSESPQDADAVPDDLPNVVKREKMTHKVFISYARKDIEKAKEITHVLEEADIPYWIDQTGIYSGENYKEVIVDAIEVAQVVLFISSSSSNASINVVREMGYAVSIGKTILPVLLDDSLYAKSIRLDIADIDQILWFKATDTAKKKLITSLIYDLSLKKA